MRAFVELKFADCNICVYINEISYFTLMPETAVCVCVYLCECFLNFNIAYLFVLITSFYSDKLADMTPCCALYSASFLSISNYNLQLKHLIVF